MISCGRQAGQWLTFSFSLARLAVDGLLILNPRNQKTNRQMMRRQEEVNSKEASVRLGHKSLRTLMKRSSSWYLPGLGLESHEEDSCI